MPRILAPVVFAALAAAAYALEVESGEKGDSYIDFSMGGGDRGNGHVDFKEDPSGGGWVWAVEGGAFACRADLLLTDAGAAVYATDHDNNHIDFRVDIDADGNVSVNGEDLAACDPADGCLLAIAWSATTNALVVEVVATDGAVVAAQYYLEQAPAELHIDAAEIRYLSLTRQ